MVIIMKELAIYIHMPFCASKCYYCDFISFCNCDDEIDTYIENLLIEIELYRQKINEYKIRTIYLGGGTPSYLEAKHIKKLLGYIYENFDAKEIIEITIETNPGTIDEKKLETYKQCGINRISIGVQSLNESLIKSIGRGHSTDDIYKSFQLLSDYGFDNINADLIYGLPNQTIEDCQRSLEKMAALNIKHISYYSLILEEGTKMHRWHEEGKIKLPDEEVEREMYYCGINFLKQKGYKHYEISNFANDGFECKHNLFYWTLKPYIGIGLGAHSNIDKKRFWNYNNFKEYYDRLNENKYPVCGMEEIDINMEIAEYMIMGLRLIEGINKKSFEYRFNKQADEVYKMALKKHMEQGLITMDRDWIRFTPKGLDLSNIVYVDLLP